MTKLLVTIPASIEKELRKDSNEQDKPIASIVRRALVEYYERRGVLVEGKVGRGGWRPRRDTLPEAG